MIYSQEYKLSANLRIFLLILIVSPGNTVGPHLKALSSVSRLLADGAVRQDLIEAETPSDFLTILRKAEDKYLENKDN